MNSETRSAIRDAAQDIIDHLDEHLDYAYESTNLAFVELLSQHSNLLMAISDNVPDESDSRWLNSKQIIIDIDKWQSTTRHITTLEMMETLALMICSIQNWLYKEYADYPPIPDPHPRAIVEAAKHLVRDSEYIDIEELDL